MNLKKIPIPIVQGIKRLHAKYSKLREIMVAFRPVGIEQEGTHAHVRQSIKNI